MDLYGNPWNGWLPLGWVGDANPGAQWSQAPTEQEKKSGVKKTDLMSLQMRVGQLRTKIDSLVASMDPSTAADVQSSLKSLQAKVASLDTAAAALAQGQGGNYAVLSGMCSGYEQEFASYGVQEPAAPSPPPPAQHQAPAPAPSPQPKTPAPPPAPLAQKKGGLATTAAWGAAGALVAVGVSLIAKGVGR